MADNTTATSFQAAAYTSQGTARDKVALPETLFDGTVNMPVMHQAVKAFLANQRQGNAATKIRKYVTGGNQKPWKQKGTGRARAGSTRAPHWVGGGTVFGPIPRSYAQYVPRQVRALARKSALNARARENAIFVIDRFEYDAPKTSRLSALVDAPRRRREESAHSHRRREAERVPERPQPPTVHVMPYSDVSTYHILWSDVVLIEAGALGQTLAPIAEEREAATHEEDAPRRTRRPRSPRRRRPQRRRPRRRRRRRPPRRRPAKKAAKAAGREEGGRQEAGRKKSAKKKGK